MRRFVSSFVLGPSSFRRGFTITELLIVITIMVIVMAMAATVIPRLQERQRSVDSSALLQGHLQMARTTAAKNNRPVGLEIELQPLVGALPTDLTRQCTRVFLAEVPPLYAGSTTVARGIVRTEPNNPLLKPEFVPLTGADGNGDGRIDEDTAEKAVLLSLIDPGDTCLVKFEYKGDWFRLIRGTTVAPLSTYFPDTQRLYLYIGRNPPPPIALADVVAASLSGNATPPSYNNSAAIGYRYQILRMPRRVGNPLEMSAGMAVDIEYSGMGPGGVEFGGLPTVPVVPLNRVIVMFAPSGGIDGLVLDNDITPPTGTIHFLVGRVEKVNDPLGVPDTGTPNPTGRNMFGAGTSNLLDDNSVWVSVGRNGSISTTENMPPPVDPTTLSATNVTIFPGDPRQQALNPNVAADRATYIGFCREAASARKQMGGN